MARRALCRIALLAAACAASWPRVAMAQAAPPPKEGEVVVPSDWRQTFMAPRVTGNLRAVAVDPSDAKSIYVGTEEGTLAHSTDGGVTWDEIDLSPFTLKSPTISPVLVLDTFKQVDIWAGCHIEPSGLWGIQKEDDCDKLYLYRNNAAAFFPLSAPSFIPITWNMFFRVLVARFDAPPEPLLAQVAANDPKGYHDLVRIKVCPGAQYGVVVATKTLLFGALDGTNFLPLFSARESAPIRDIACSPANSSELVMATGDGTYRSTDGGATFDLMGGELGGLASTALAFGPPDKNGHEQLFVATGNDLWVGDPNVFDAMHNLPLNAFGTIESVAVTARSVWLATDLGIRVSHDGGASWGLLNDLENTPWRMVAAVAGDAGNEHVAVLRDDVVMESKDGETFTPSFAGPSRRRNRQIVAGPDGTFYLVTSGEVFTNAPPPKPKPGEEDTRRWASERLRRMPSLGDTMQRALAYAKLTDVQIDKLETAIKTRGWLPGISVFVGFQNGITSEGRGTVISNPSNVLSATNANVFTVTGQLVWELPDLVATPGHFYSGFQRNKAQLYEIRKRFSYIVEDAYTERRQVLTQIEDGGLDAEQLLTLESRVELLDVVLQQFTGEAR